MNKITNIIAGSQNVSLNAEQVDLILSGLEQKANFFLQEIRKPDNSWEILKTNSLELWKIANLAMVLEGNKNDK